MQEVFKIWRFRKPSFKHLFLVLSKKKEVFLLGYLAPDRCSHHPKEGMGENDSILGRIDNRTNRLRAFGSYLIALPTALSSPYVSR